MKIIDINIGTDMELFIDMLIRKIIENNESYVLINEDNYCEIHFSDYIVRVNNVELLLKYKFYSLADNSFSNDDLRLLLNKINNKNIISTPNVNDIINLENIKFIDLEPKVKKEKNPALKKLKKSDYKKSKGSSMPFKKYR